MELLVEPKCRVHIKALAPGEASIYLRGMIEGEEVCGTYIQINVVEGYYNLTPVNVDNVLLGEELDLGGIDWALTYYTIGAEEQEVEIGENIRFCLSSYDPRVWDLTDKVSSGPLPGLVRKRPWGTYITVTVEEKIKDGENNESWNKITERNLTFDNLDYPTELEDSYGHRDVNRIFTGEELELRLVQSKDSPQELPENYTVEWEIYRYDENGQQQDETNITKQEASDSYSVKLNVSEDYVGQSVWVIARTYYQYGPAAEDKIEISCTDIRLEICETVYNYQMPDIGNMLPGWNYGLNSVNCYVMDQKYPAGENVSVPIKNIEILEQLTWDENGQGIASTEDIITCSSDEEGNWNLHAETYGYVKLKFTYDSVKDEETSLTYGDGENEEFIVYVVGDVYGLALSSNTGTDQLLPGNSLDLRADAWLNCYDGERYYDGDMNGTWIQWTLAEGEDVVTIKDSNDNHVLQVTANEGMEDREAKIEARLMVPIGVDGEENPQSEERAYAEFWIYVRGSYYQLVLDPGDETIRSLAPGSPLKITPTLYLYDGNNPGGKKIGTEGDTTEIRYRWEWDTNALKIVDKDGKELTQATGEGESTEEGEPAEEISVEGESAEEAGDEGKESTEDNTTGEAPFTITKKENRDTDAWLIAELDESGEVTRYNLQFSSQDYNTWFDDLRGDRYTWVFSDEDLNVSLNREHLDGVENITVDWTVGTWDEESESFTEILNPETTRGYYSINGDQLGIVLHGDKLAEVYNQEVNNTHFDIKADVKVNGVVVSGDWIGAEVCEPTIEYDYPEGDSERLPGWNFGIDKCFGARVTNKDYPSGKDCTVEITGTEVECDDGSPNAVTCELRQDESGWDFCVNDYGHAVVTLTYQIPFTEAEGTYSFQVWVNSEVYGLNVRSDTGTDHLLPGNSLNLTADAWLDCYDGESHYDGSTEGTWIQWTLAEGKDVVIIEEDSKDNHVLRITANEGMEDREAKIEARLMVPAGADGEENSQSEERAYAEFWIYVRDSYYQLVLDQGDETIRSLAPGSPLKITPTLYLYDGNNQGGKKIGTEGDTTEIRYRWEWDTNALKIVDAAGKELTQATGEGGSTEEGEPAEEISVEGESAEEAGAEGKESTEDNTAGEAPFTITKKENRDTDAWLIAELDESGEVTRYNLQFSSQDYNTWFDDLRGDRYTWVFSDEDLKVSLNREHLDGVKNITVDWTVGTWDEESESFTEILNPDQISDAGSGNETTRGYYSINEDQLSIVLYGDKLAEVYNQEADNTHFDIKADVKVNGVVVSGDQIGAEVCTPVYEYRIDYSEEEHRLPGEWIWIDRILGYHEESQVYPNGFDTKTVITDVTVDVTNGAEKALSCDEQFDENGNSTGWVLFAHNICEAEVTLTYKKAGSDAKENAGGSADDTDITDSTNITEGTEDAETAAATGTYKFNVYVDGERYDIHIDTNNTAMQLIPRETINLNASVSHSVIGEPFVEDDNQITLTWEIGEKRDTDEADPVSLDFEGEDNESGRKCVVTANTVCNVQIIIKAFRPAEEGEAYDDSGKIEVTRTDIWINVSDYQIRDYTGTGTEPVDTEQYLVPGEQITIRPVLNTVDHEGNPLVYSGDIYYQWEYDDSKLTIEPNEMEVSSAGLEDADTENMDDGTAGSEISEDNVTDEETEKEYRGPEFTITKNSSDWTSARLIAKIRDNNLEYQEVTCREWYFNEID